MARPSEAHLQAAKRLLARERPSGGYAKERAAAAGLVYETLFESLAPVIGEAGMRALFARSVKLAQAEFPCLAELAPPLESPTHSAPLAPQLVSCLSKLEPAAALEAATRLYATFLGLMTQFIGDPLVRQIVKGAFPAIDEALPEETAQ